MSTQPQPAFGALLRRWRETRKQSQLNLALDANVSQRHLSFLESGRAAPSKEMVIHLASALDIPLRERNLFLRAAGYAPVFHERQLEDEDMQSVKQALEMMLHHHEPFPAVVANRCWDLKMLNKSAQRFVGLLGNLDQVWQAVDPSGDQNFLRMTFHPNGLRPLLKNWDHISRQMLAHLQRELNADPTNSKLQLLLDELMQWADLPSNALDIDWARLPPVLPLEINMGGQSLKVFSMISTLGTALDITAEELRVETFFPADEFSKQFFQQLAQFHE